MGHKVEIRGTYNSKPKPVALDSNGYLYTNSVGVTTLGVGRQTVSPANTQTQLYVTPTSCQWVTIQALRSNTGYVAVGSTPGVSATPSAEYGIVMESLDTYTIPVSDLSTVWINATTTNDGVSYTYGA